MSCLRKTICEKAEKWAKKHVVITAEGFFITESIQTQKTI